MTIPTLQFEGVKVAMKQDKSGYVLTLSIHPDEVPEDLLRDYVGARYQIVMARLNDDESPFPRKTPGVIAAAGILCRSPIFWDWLLELGEIQIKSESSAVEALHRIIGVNSRSELSDPKAAAQYDLMVQEYQDWKTDRPPF
jgi:hypothetical protein